MADSAVAALTASDALAGSELFYADGLASAAAADVKVTATQIKTWCSSSPTLVTPVLGAATGTSVSVTGALTAFSGTGIPAGGTAGSGLKVSSTSNFGVFFGSGAPTLSAAKGSLYLRSDGSTTNDRMYVNTNGSTTWTAVTTAA